MCYQSITGKEYSDSHALDETSVKAIFMPLIMTTVSQLTAVSIYKCSPTDLLHDMVADSPAMPGQSEASGRHIAQSLLPLAR